MVEICAKPLNAWVAMRVAVIGRWVLAWVKRGRLVLTTRSRTHPKLVCACLIWILLATLVETSITSSIVIERWTVLLLLNLIGRRVPYVWTLHWVLRVGIHRPLIHIVVWLVKSLRVHLRRG